MKTPDLDVKMIDIDKIKPDENQPRKIFDEKELQSLAQSIDRYGLLQPIIVRKMDEKYIIIAGERRYRALKILEKTKAPCIEKNSYNYKEISLIENIQREDLSPIEEAEALSDLLTEKGYTHEQLGKIVGKSRSYISNKLRLLNLDDKTKSLLKQNKIAEGHARALLGEKNDEKRKSLARQILKEGLNVRRTEKKVKKHKSENIQELTHIKDVMEDFLSTKVTIEISEKKGQMIIEFYSIDQLEEIASKIYKD